MVPPRGPDSESHNLTQFRSENRASWATAATSSTVSNQPGPGRTLALLLTSVGRRLERWVDAASEHLSGGANVNTVVVRMLPARDGSPQCPCAQPVSPDASTSAESSTSSRASCLSADPDVLLDFILSSGNYRCSKCGQSYGKALMTHYPFLLGCEFLVSHVGRSETLSSAYPTMRYILAFVAIYADFLNMFLTIGLGNALDSFAEKARFLSKALCLTQDVDLFLGRLKNVLPVLKEDEPFAFTKHLDTHWGEFRQRLVQRSGYGIIWRDNPAYQLTEDMKLLLTYMKHPDTRFVAASRLLRIGSSDGLLPLLVTSKAVEVCWQVLRTCKERHDLDILVVVHLLQNIFRSINEVIYILGWESIQRQVLEPTAFYILKTDIGLVFGPLLCLLKAIEKTVHRAPYLVNRTRDNGCLTFATQALSYIKEAKRLSPAHESKISASVSNTSRLLGSPFFPLWSAFQAEWYAFSQDNDLRIIAHRRRIELCQMLIEAGTRSRDTVSIQEMHSVAEKDPECCHELIRLSEALAREDRASMDTRNRAHAIFLHVSDLCHGSNLKRRISSSASAASKRSNTVRCSCYKLRKGRYRWVEFPPDNELDVNHYSPVLLEASRSHDEGVRRALQAAVIEPASQGQNPPILCQYLDGDSFVQYIDHAGVTQRTHKFFLQVLYTGK